MRPSSWSLVAAALFATFQAWLWFSGSYPIAAVSALALAFALALTAAKPISGLARILTRIWAPAKRPGETERHYRLRIAVLWLLVAVAAYAVGYVIPPSESSLEGELRETYIFVGVASTIFVALMMSFQSALVAFFQGTDSGDT
jgi:hypothetical protein